MKDLRGLISQFLRNITEKRYVKKLTLSTALLN